MKCCGCDGFFLGMLAMAGVIVLSVAAAVAATKITDGMKPLCAESADCGCEDPCDCGQSENE